MTATSTRGPGPEIAVFLGVVALLTCALTALAVTQDADVAHLDETSALGQAALFGVAFVPGMAALVARAWGARTVRGLGVRFGASRRYLGRAYLAPLALTAVAYGAVWIAGLGGFEPAELAEDGMPAAVVAVVGLTIGVLPFALLALGEELGWQGLLAPRLAERMPLMHAALWTGLAWSAFHLPLMLFVDGAVEGVPTAYAIAAFTVGTVALALPLTWLRLRSGSIWPAVVLHAAWNAAVYLVADPLTTDTGDTAWFAGEGGIALPVVTAVAVALWWRRVGAPGRTRGVDTAWQPQRAG